jgi:uncharacterized protein (TIGR02466 family)
MYFHFIFSNLLCVDTLDLNNTELEAYAKNLSQSTEGRKYTNRGGWQSEFIDEEPEVQDLIQEINGRLEALRSTLHFRDDLDLRVESMWINVNHPYSYNAPHTHPNSYMSGVYYVKVPKNSGDLVLKHPSNLQSIFTPSGVIKSYNEYNCSKWNITPEAGKLIMFPSWIEHEVAQNLSGEDRLSIAFNTAFFTKG